MQNLHSFFQKLYFGKFPTRFFVAYFTSTNLTYCQGVLFNYNYNIQVNYYISLFYHILNTIQYNFLTTL